MTPKRKLQKDFSAVYGAAVFNPHGRRQKAEKALSIIRDRYPQTHDLDLLDIGCAAGYGTKTYAGHFRFVVGVDIDEPAVVYAAWHNAMPHLRYIVMDSQQIAFPDESFDIVVCTHVYEHVPDAGKLMAEIYRLLKVGGACYFTAGNRISLMEPHYQLPLLSVLLKWLAHFYLRIFNRGDFYHETHLTYLGIKKARIQVSSYGLYRRCRQKPRPISCDRYCCPGVIQATVLTGDTPGGILDLPHISLVA